MNSFKVLTEVAPNGVLTYISNLYPGSISDKEIVQQSGFLQRFLPGDLILADKGFLIQDIVPDGSNEFVAFRFFHWHSSVCSKLKLYRPCINKAAA